MPEPLPSLYVLVIDTCDAHPELTDEQVADLVIDALADRVAVPVRNRPAFTACLLTVVANTAAAHRRQRTRLVERLSFARPWADLQPGPRPARGPAVTVTAGGYQPDVVELRALLNERFVIERKGLEVTWGLATVEQHEQRIAYLLRQRNAVDVTISRHRTAVETIRSKPGATCLADALRPAA